MRIRLVVPLALLVGFVPIASASAQIAAASSEALLAGVTFVTTETPPLAPLRLTFTSPDQGQSGQPVGTPRTKAFVYSDGYRTRAKIHKYASLATLPLFIAEGFVGQSLYNSPTESKKSAHLAIAGGIGALFGVNAVTGVWNLLEARKDPNGHTKRTVHGILMLAASAGFVATAATAPESEFGDHGQGEGEGGGGSRSLHRGVAFTSIGLATASYLIMLFGK